MQYHVLNNDVRAAFIKPKKQGTAANKACISICLNQGHFHAMGFPDGFAHLYEHMLFNASTKYENANALDTHLIAHHGEVNAWTQNTITHIHMSCDPVGFISACEILLDRISAPLFLNSDIEKEILAIEAEFNANKRDPIRQLVSVQQDSANPLHPFTKFSSGNLQSLAQISTDDTRKLLQKYHQNVMQGKHLSICFGISEGDSADGLCGQVLSKIQATVGSLKHAKNPPLNVSPFITPIFLEEHLGQFIQVKHDNSHHQLIISYIVVPDKFTPALQQSTVFIMLCHLLESKHEYGLYHALQSRKLATDIHSYYNWLDDATVELVISISLSDEGAAMPQDIFHYTQLFVSFLQNHGIESWRFREHDNQHALSLIAVKGSSLLEDCIALSTLLKIGKKKDDAIAALSPDITNRQNPAEAAMLAEYLIAELTYKNVRVHFISPTAISNSTSAHYNTPYSISVLQEDIKVPIANVNFTKPRKNPYIAGQYSLVTQQCNHHDVLDLQNQHSRLKFYQDLRFNLPTAQCYISISDPYMFGSTSKSLAKRIWLSCLNEHLASIFFDVELASMHYRVYAHHHGITIHTSGLSERQLLLCIEIVNTIIQFTATKENLKKHLKKAQNNANDKPKQRLINQLFSALNEFYQPPEKTSSGIVAGLDALTIDELLTLQTDYFEENFTESLVMGNLQLESAKRFHDLLSHRLPSTTEFIKPKMQALSIKSGKHICMLCPQSEDKCLIWHYIPVISEAERELALVSARFKLTLCARALVLEKLLAHTVFEVLRQQNKMGYELGAGYKPIGRYPGVALYAVSQSHSPAQILKAMQQAIHKAKVLLVEDQVNIQQILTQLTRQVTPKDNDISQSAKRAWLHFEDKNPILAYQDLADALENVTKNEILTALEILTSCELGQLTLASCEREELIK